MGALITAYRVQDRAGRGPYKPGMTDRWSDLSGSDWPAIMQDFGIDWQRDIPLGWAAACAFRSMDHLARWFSATECDRLAQLGYCPVAAPGCLVIRENERQLIVARALPFRMRAGSMAWPHRAPACLDPWKALTDA